MQSTSENDLEHWCERATNSQDDGMVGAWTGNPDVIPEADIRFEPDEIEGTWRLELGNTLGNNLV
jgi:hypothetical protein